MSNQHQPQPTEAKHLVNWGDAHMYSEEELHEHNPRILEILDYLVIGNTIEELAIMYVQHLNDQEFKDLEFEVDNQPTGEEIEADYGSDQADRD